MVAISNLNGFDTAQRWSQPPTPAIMGVVEVAAPLPLQAAVADHPPLPLDPPVQMAPAALHRAAHGGGA